MDIAKSLVIGLPKFVVNERANDYRASYLRNQELLAKVSLEHSRALMTFSIAGLAALAALNNQIFEPHPILSIAAIVCFITIIAVTVLNYLFFSKMLTDAQKIITSNYKKSLTTPLGEGMDKVGYKRHSNITSLLSSILFIIGILLFIILIVLYIAGVET